MCHKLLFARIAGFDLKKDRYFEKSKLECMRSALSHFSKAGNSFNLLEAIFGTRN